MRGFERLRERLREVEREVEREVAREVEWLRESIERARDNLRVCV